MGEAFHVQFLGDAFDDRCSSGWRPATDIYETAGSVIIKMAISGLRLPQDAEIRVIDSEVIIRGRRRDYSAADKTAYHHMELCYGPFERRFVINVPFDPDHIEAHYEDGFLFVELPKAATPPRKRVELIVSYE